MPSGILIEVKNIDFATSQIYAEWMDPSNIPQRALKNGELPNNYQEDSSNQKRLGVMRKF